MSARLQGIFSNVAHTTIACLLAAGGACAFAADFPSHPLRMIVPFAPGGNADIMARLIAARLTESVGQQVVVDNRAGASSIIGTELTVKAAPDGYTFVLVASSIATNSTLFNKMPYDTLRDLAPITIVGSTPLILAAYPGLPVATVKEFVALAKAKPGQLNYSSAGTGGIGHLTGVLLAKQTGGTYRYIDVNTFR